MFSSKKAKEALLNEVDLQSRKIVTNIVEKGEAFDAENTVREFTRNIQNAWLKEYIGGNEQDGYTMLHKKLVYLPYPPHPLHFINKSTVKSSFSKIVDDALRSHNALRYSTASDVLYEGVKGLSTKKRELEKISKNLFGNYLEKDVGTIRRILKLDSKLEIQRLKGVLVAWIIALINCMTILLDVIINNVKTQESGIADAKKAGLSTTSTAQTSKAKHTWRTATKPEQKPRSQVTMGKR